MNRPAIGISKYPVLLLNRTRLPLVVLGLLLSGLPPAESTASAQSMTLLPPQARLGSDITVLAENIPYSSPSAGSVYVQADCVSMTPSATILADSFNAARLTMTLADLNFPRSPCVFSLFLAPSTLIAQANLEILSSVGLQLTPTSGPPGTSVQFTVSNLDPGELQINYAGKAVFGPKTVGAGGFDSTPISYTGSFVVPWDRPSPLGSVTQVQAVGLRGGKRAGMAQASFTSAAALPLPQPIVNNVQFSTPRIFMGQTFNITGQIQPAPGANLDHFSVNAMWEDGLGHFLPMNLAPTVIGANGYFQAQAHLPYMLDGDAVDAVHTGGVHIVAIDDRSGYATIDPNMVLQTGIALNVQTLELGTNKPLDGIVVTAIPAPGLEMHASHNYNQLWLWAKENGYEIALGSMYELYCTPIWGHITTAGVLNLELMPSLLAVNPWTESGFDIMYGGHYQVGALPTNHVTAVPTTAAQAQRPNTLPYNPWKKFVIVVDGVESGYGTPEAQPKPYPQMMYVEYNIETQAYRDANEVPIQTPIKFYLTSFGLADLHLNAVVITDALYGFKPMVGKLDVDIQRVMPTPVKVSFRVTSGQASRITNVKVTSPFGGAPVDAVKTPGDECAGNVPEYTAGFSIDSTLYLPGKYDFKIDYTYTVAGEAKNNTDMAQMEIKSLPGWFLDNSLRSRLAETRGKDIQLIAYRLSADRDRTVLNSTAEQTPNIGAQNNNQTMDLIMRSTLTAAGMEVSQTDGTLNLQSFNKNAAPRSLEQLSGEGAAPLGFALGPAEQMALRGGLSAAPPVGISRPLGLQSPAGSGAGQFSFGSGGDIQLLDTGYVPVFYAMASFLYGAFTISTGGGFWFSAKVNYDGTVTFSDPPGVILNVNPSANVGADVWVDGKLLYFLTKAEAKMALSLGLGLNTTFNNGVPETPDICFGYRYDTHLTVGAICNPFNGKCWGSKSWWKVPFIGHTPESAACKDNPGPPPWSSPESVSVATRPPQVQVSLATDNDAGVLAAWPSTLTSFTWRRFDGIGWSNDAAVTTGLGVTDLQVAFYGPGKAVAVWSESNVGDETQAEALGLDLYLATHHIAYSLWNGANWSPSQDLTAAGIGEAGVTVGNCMSNAAGCPAGGAVAAVWNRMRPGSVESDRRYDLVYAVFSNGAWSAVQSILPAGVVFDGTDSQPQVVYGYANPAVPTTKIPLVGWVRDNDRDPSTTADRRLALRWMGPAYEVVIPSTIRAGVAEFALAMKPNGYPALVFTQIDPGTAILDNRHTLHTANNVCFGGCNWEVFPVLDQYSRPVMGERPLLNFDQTGAAIVTLRGTGFGLIGGKALRFSEDTLGMTLRTGDLVQIESRLDGTPRTLQALTNDGQVNWKPAAIYNPLMRQIIAVAMSSTAPVPAATRQAFADWRPSSDARTVMPAVPLPTVGSGPAEAQASAASPMKVFAVPRLPDFMLASATVSTLFPEPGQSFSVTVHVRNDGADPAGTKAQLLLQAAWDDVPGLGASAATDYVLPKLSSSEETEVILPLNVPAGADPTVFLGKRHTLNIAVNAGQTLTETTSVNNYLSIQLGGIPTPTGLSGFSELGHPEVLLAWTPSTDSRVAGYRIYRSSNGGAWEPAGSALGTGWLDPTSRPSGVYAYAISAYTAQGFESDQSDRVQVMPAPWRVHLPLIRR